MSSFPTSANLNSVLEVIESEQLCETLHLDMEQDLKGQEEAVAALSETNIRLQRLAEVIATSQAAFTKKWNTTSRKPGSNKIVDTPEKVLSEHDETVGTEVTQNENVTTEKLSTEFKNDIQTTQSMEKLLSRLQVAVPDERASTSKTLSDVRHLDDRRQDLPDETNSSRNLLPEATLIRERSLTERRPIMRKYRTRPTVPPFTTSGWSITNLKNNKCLGNLSHREPTEPTRDE